MANGLRLRAAVAAAMLAAVPAAAQDAPERGIERVAGDVYRFQNAGHYNVFMVTPEGIVATDPINAEAAKWLESEMEERFGVPVKYLIYSHDHADHISGGEVFADTATVIAHENAVPHIVGEGVPTALPDITFSDRMTVTLGGKSVELIYLGYNHSDNMIVMRFPAERIVFAVDWVGVESVAYRDFPYGYIEQWIEGLEKLEAIDFDILATAHGRNGVRADVAVHRGYLADLRSQVLTQMRAGKTLDEIKQLVDLDKYKGWRGFEPWSELNVEGMVRHLTLYRGAR